MPRPNRPRSIASESALAERITYEREKHGWSYAGLAQRMTEVGCPIDQSAIYKIEKGQPARRRISVDELVALARVFELGLDDLLVPPDLAVEQETLALLEDYRAADAARRAAWDRLLAHYGASPHRVRDVLDRHLKDSDIPVDLVRAAAEGWTAKVGTKWLTPPTTEELDEIQVNRQQAATRKGGGGRGKRREAP